MEDILRVALMAGLGLYEKLRQGMDELVKKGELSKAEGAEFVRDLMGKEVRAVQDLEQKIHTVLHETLERAQSAVLKRHVKHLKRIEAKLDTLSARLTRVEKRHEPDWTIPDQVDPPGQRD
ncbi:MAG: phasin family protein [Nitrospirales bacterium]